MGSQDYWNESLVHIHLWDLLWVYRPEHAREKRNDWAYRLEGKATLTNGLHLGRSKCWGAWDITYWHKAKDITPPTAWRREIWGQEGCARIDRQGTERSFNWCRKGERRQRGREGEKGGTNGGKETWAAQVTRGREGNGGGGVKRARRGRRQACGWMVNVGRTWPLSSQRRP